MQQERMKKVREILSAAIVINVVTRPMLVFNLWLRVSNETYQLTADVICKLAMNVIRMIKLFGWEPRVKEEIGEKREEELRIIKKRQLLDLVNHNIK